MRKLKLQVQLTLDGFMAGPNGELDWLCCPWTDDINAYVDELTAPVDTIILGRKLAEGFIPYWASVAADPANPEAASGQKFTGTPKVVFTRTLKESDWENTVLATGDIMQEITNLKQSAGKDIIAYGGVAFVSSLIRHKLLDELNLFINPVAIGNGLPLFAGLDTREEMTLVKARSFDCGIVAVQYTRKDQV